MRIRDFVVALWSLQLMGCVGLELKEKKATIPVGQIKPEVDFSAETPDCITAGERIAANLQEGMALGDVIRLVGKPGWKLPGSWWWTQSFDNVGKPFVKFDLGARSMDTAVKSFSADTSDC